MTEDGGAKVEAPTVEDGLRLIRKMEKCEGDAAKLILLKNFVKRCAPAPTPATSESADTFSAKDWWHLLFAICEVCAEIDPEWLEAEEDQMSEFDPWEALRKISARLRMDKLLHATAALASRSVPGTPSTERPSFYVASRASLPERPAMWKKLRAEGANIISSWIDEAEPGATADLGELWERIYFEIKSCTQFVLYVEAGDFPLKGALIEAGIALGLGKPIAIIAPGLEFSAPSYRPIGSWIKHPAVRICPDVRTACLLNESGVPGTVEEEREK